MSRFRHIDKHYIIAFALLLTATIIWISSFSTIHFYRADAWDYAQMGRELSDGNGFSTLQILPRHIPFMHERGFLHEGNWPNLYRYPFVTILIAFLYSFTPDIIAAAIWQTGIGYLLSIPLLFLLASRLTNSKIALISTFFYAVNPEVFVGSYNGMTESWTTCFLLLLLLLVLNEHLGKRRCILAGIVCGLIYLTRSQFITLFPLMILLFWLKAPKNKRIFSIALLFLGFLVAAGPWFARNFMVAGSPVFSFSNTRNLTIGTLPDHPDLEYQLDAPYETSVILEQYGTAIAEKFIKNLQFLVHPDYWSISFSQDAFLLLCLLISFLFRLHSKKKSYIHFRDFTFILIICTCLLTCLAIHQKRFFAPMLPLMYVIGFHEAFLLLDKERPAFLKWLKYAVYLGLIALVVYRSVELTEIHQKPTSQYQEAQSTSYEYLKPWVDRDTVVAASTSYILSVKTGCRSIRLPAYPEDLLKIDEEYIEVDFVLISNWSFKMFPVYYDFVESVEFTDKFTLLQELPYKSKLYVKSTLYDRLK
ncbi:MAG: ArnT family glycosyltransferase [Planctomycetota bacterium]